MSFSNGGGSSGEVLDILLKLSGLQAFVAGTREASASVRGIGTAAKETTAQSDIMGKRMTGAAGLASKAFRNVGLAAGVFAYFSTKMAINFQQQMELVHTQAGATQTEVTNMSKSILGMSASGMYAQGPVQLAQGLYHLESIGLRGTKALDALKIASQGAAVGNANLEDTSTALGAAWLTNIKGAGNLYNVMSTLNATAGAGNIRMQQLVESLGTGVLGAAKLAGLGMTDVMGALATLTDEGYQGSSAMAQLATSFHFLTDPTAKARKALSSIGLGTYELSNTMRTKGLPQALMELRTHLNRLAPAQREATLGDILPGGRGRVLEVLMNQVDRYGMKINQINKTSGNFAKGIAATHRTAAFQIHAAWAQIQADMVKIGTFLIPIGVAFAKGMSSVITWLVKIAPTLGKILPYLAPLVAGFIAYRGAVILAALANAIFAGFGTIRAFLSLAMSVRSLGEAWILLDIAMEANPIFLIIGAVVALAAGFVVLYLKCSWFRHAIQAIWTWMKGAAKDTVDFVIARFHDFLRIARSVINWIGNHWKLLLLIMMGPMGFVIDVIVTHFKWLKHIAGEVIDFVGGKFKWLYNNVIKPVANWMVGAFRWSINMLNKIFSTVGHILGSPFKWTWDHVIKPVFNWLVGAARWAAKEVAKAFNIALGPVKTVAHLVGKVTGFGGSIGKSVLGFAGIHGLQGGGTLTSSGVALVGEQGPELLSLPRGAQVTPFSSPAATGGNYTFVIPVQIDGREVVRATGKYVDNRLARQ